MFSLLPLPDVLFLVGGFLNGEAIPDVSVDGALNLVPLGRCKEPER